VCLQLHALAHNLGNSCGRWQRPSEPSIGDDREGRLIKIGAKVVSRGRYVAFQTTEVANSQYLFADILLIAGLRPPPIVSSA
jgi:hypothetical protein